MSSHVLITGGNGFLGRALCAFLLFKGHRVTAMVRRHDAFLPAGVACWVAPNLPYIGQDAAQIFVDVDVVVHTAGRVHMVEERETDQLTAFRLVNTDGTLAVARTAAKAGVRLFIFVSSIGVNGSKSQQNAFRYDDKPKPDSPYAQSKWEAEQALNLLQAETSMKVIHLRPPLIYGNNAPGNFALLSSLVAKGWPLPLGGLNAPRSFAALENVVDLLAHMVLHPNPPEGVYLVSDAKVTSTTQFIQEMARGMGKSICLFPVPVGVLLVLFGILGRSDQIRKMSSPLELDIHATVSRLGWTPQVTMEEAMQRAYLSTPASNPLEHMS